MQYRELWLEEEETVKGDNANIKDLYKEWMINLETVAVTLHKDNLLQKSSHGDMN